jgi:hypothetical protein
LIVRRMFLFLLRHAAPVPHGMMAPKTSASLIASFLAGPWQTNCNGGIRPVGPAVGPHPMESQLGGHLGYELIGAGMLNPRRNGRGLPSTIPS